jgi:hypothetical protein
MDAKTAATYIAAYCRETFKTEPHGMESYLANDEMMEAFNPKGYGSREDIPADKLTEDLGMPRVAGVYGYWAMADGSYLLQTCSGRLACWSGKATDKAEFPV